GFGNLVKSGDSFKSTGIFKSVETEMVETEMVETEMVETVETLHCNVSTVSTDSTPLTDSIDSSNSTDPFEKDEYYSSISPKSGSLSAIVRNLKSYSTRHIRQAFPSSEFAWQERFYDHIIRNEEAYRRITTYIMNNPMNWKED